MKILHVINSLHPGGAETLLVKLIRHLKPMGYEQTLYVLNPTETPLLREVDEMGIAVVRGPTKDVYRISQVTALVDHLRTNHYDLVHVHLFPAQLWAAIAAIISRVDVHLVTTEHSTCNRRRKAFFRPLDAWMYHQYSRIVCVSVAARESLIEWLPFLKEKTVIAYNGVDWKQITTAPSADRSEFVGDSSQPIAMFTARFEPAKDHETLLKALVNVPHLRLLLVGDGAQRAEMEKLSQELGLDPRVRFLGRRSDVPALLNMVDLYIHSVHWEGFGLAVLEAMASGKAVVATRVPGLSEVVGEAGLLYDPGDVRGLEQCILRLMDDPQLREQLGSAAKVRARKFGIDETARRYAMIYDAVLRNAELDEPSSAGVQRG